MAIMALLK